MLTEGISLFFLHKFSFVMHTVSFLRLSFMYFMLGIIFGRFNCSTNLIFDEIKKVLLCNLSFFFACNVMNSLKMWSIRYAISVLIITLAMTFIAIVANRYFRIWFRKYLAQNVIIIGTGSEAQDLIQVYKYNRFSMSEVKATINCNNSQKITGIHQKNKVSDIHIIEYDNLLAFLNKEKIDEAIIAIPDISQKNMETIFSDISPYVSVIKSMPKVNGIVTYQSKVEDFDGAVLISSATGLMSQNLLGMFFKRAIDIIGSIIGIILLIPLTIFVKIKFLNAGDNGNIFFTQKRIGKDGKLFEILKYRTMVSNAEELLDDLLTTNPDFNSEYMLNKKIENDPRVTTVGRFLRRTSLDEFPQMINILKGEMSFIGPRPYLPQERKDMGNYYSTIIKCKPGLTGMWQTHGRSIVSFKQRLKYDNYYYRNWSIWLDLTIFIKTIRTVSERIGAM